MPYWMDPGWIWTCCRVIYRTLPYLSPLFGCTLNDQSTGHHYPLIPSYRSSAILYCHDIPRFPLVLSPGESYPKRTSVPPKKNPATLNPIGHATPPPRRIFIFFFFFFFFFFFSPPSSTTSTHSLSFDILIDLFVFLNRQNAYLLREFIFIYILSLTQVFFLPRLLDGCFADE